MRSVQSECKPPRKSKYSPKGQWSDKHHDAANGFILEPTSEVIILQSMCKIDNDHATWSNNHTVGFLRPKAMKLLVYLL